MYRYFTLVVFWSLVELNRQKQNISISSLVTDFHLFSISSQQWPKFLDPARGPSCYDREILGLAQPEGQQPIQTSIFHVPLASHHSIYNNNDRLTAFDPGQPG